MMRSAMAESHVENDLICEGCGYNLRALPLSNACPECGAAVMDSFRSAALNWHAGASDRGIVDAFAATIGCTADGVLFVKDAIQRTLMEQSEQSDSRDGIASSHMRASDICN